MLSCKPFLIPPLFTVFLFSWHVREPMDKKIGMALSRFLSRSGQEYAQYTAAGAALAGRKEGPFRETGLQVKEVRGVGSSRIEAVKGEGWGRVAACGTTIRGLKR